MGSLSIPSYPLLPVASTHLNHGKRTWTNSVIPSQLVLLLLNFYKWKRDGEERGKSNSWWERVFIILSATLWVSNFYTDNLSFALSVLITINRQNSHLYLSHGRVYWTGLASRFGLVVFSPQEATHKGRGKSNYSHLHPEFWMRQSTQGELHTLLFNSGTWITAWKTFDRITAFLMRSY